MHIISARDDIIQCNFSKPNTLGTKEMVQFREVSGLERFLCTANIESRT